MKHKEKPLRPNDLKAEAIRRFGTIKDFARHTGHRTATVYSALKNKRNGKVAKAIRAALEMTSR